MSAQRVPWGALKPQNLLSGASNRLHHVKDSPCCRASFPSEPRFPNLLLEQLGRDNSGLKAAMQSFIQAFGATARIPTSTTCLMDIAPEQFGHRDRETIQKRSDSQPRS
jgi:hypothetical protein